MFRKTAAFLKLAGQPEPKTERILSLYKAPAQATQETTPMSSQRIVKKELDLPSGVHAVVYKGKGKHLRDAGRVADITKEGPMGYQQALIAQLVTFDGREVTYEEVLEMDLDDVQAVMGAMTGKDETAKTALSSPPVTLPS